MNKLVAVWSGTQVGVFVFSVKWSELLMNFAISCPLWSSVYTSARWWSVGLHLRRGQFDVLYAVLYVCVRCLVVRWMCCFEEVGELSVFGKMCTVAFLAVCKCLLTLWQL